jgi:hypothetical protein
MKTTGKPSRRIAEDVAACQDEIVAAVAALSKKEQWRLEQYARFRIRGLGRASMGRDHQVLLRDAITDTYAGNRRWNKESVDFSQHLKGAMRSISSHWREQFDPDEAYLESEVTRVSADGKSSNPMLEVASAELGPERALEIKEMLKQVEQIASENEVAWFIMDGKRRGMTGPEIREDLSISQKDYDAAMKWLHRRVRATANKEGSNG